MIGELADLEHSLDLANKATFHGLAGATKAENLLTLSRLRSKLDALDASVITAFEATQEHAAEGHASVIGWLQHRREHGDDAARRKRLAKRLRLMPIADQAMVDGEITAHHVDVLHRAWRMVGEEAFAIGEQALVDAAVVKRFSDFARLVEYFIYAAGPTEAADREQQQYEERYGSSSRTLDGCGKVDAWMTPIPFTFWQAELERLMEVLYQEDRAEAQERLGRRPLASELARTTRQRRVDAMVLMAERSAAFDDPEGPGPSRFVLNLHSDTDLLAKILEVIRGGIQDPDLDLDASTGADRAHPRIPPRARRRHRHHRQHHRAGHPHRRHPRLPVRPGRSAPPLRPGTPPVHQSPGRRPSGPVPALLSPLRL